MLRRKLFRTMKLYRAQFISMIVMIALGMGIFVGFHMEWVSLRRNTDALFDSTGYADYRISAETGFSAEDLRKIAAIDGVDAAARFLAVTADVENADGDSVTLTVTTDSRVSGFLVTSGDAYDPADTEGVWLSDSYAAANGVKTGDRIAFLYKNIRIDGTVKGLIKSGEYMICVRDESQLMPDYTTHGFAYISPAMYEAKAGFAFYPSVYVRSGMEKEAFTDAVDRALGNTPVILTKEESAAYAGVNGEVEEGKTMGSVLPVLFLLIAFLTMTTTMHRLTAKEKTQIGTLKALGFHDRRILLHYTSYALVIGLLGSLIGLGLGYGICYIIINPDGMMGTYMDLPQWRLYVPWFCYVILVAFVALMTLIGWLSCRRMLHGTPADALRPYVPKKMKPLAVEKTNNFHRLSFGTRWNLRDIFRHKARTAMSLIGITGCMLLVVGSLGMRDTYAAFIDQYFGDATNYASRIYLSEEADDAAREAVVRRYDGDWSASVAVQMEEEKAVSLDVYHVEKDKVRFPSEKRGYTVIGDDGAYICVRLADTFHLSEGSEFSVSPYGSGMTYRLRVAGIIRSTSESVVVSPAYADRLGIPYRIDSVYTDTEKADVAADASIKSVLSKQMIVDSFESISSMMDTMLLLLVGGALLLGIIVLYNLGIMGYTERYREMATLKVVGFRDRRIGHLLIQQNLWLSFVGILLGIPAGIGTLAYLLKVLAGEYEMRMSVSFLSIAVSILLTVGMSLLVSLMVARKNRKIDMVEALKGAE